MSGGGWIGEPERGEFGTDDWHPRVALVYRHWRGLWPGPETLPSRRHFDPFVIPAAMPSLWLLDIQREPLRLRYRLVGTNITQVIGMDPTGRWLDEARPTIADDAVYLERHRWSIDNRRATWRKGTPRLDRDPHWQIVENAYMPFAVDGRAVDMLLCVSVFYGYDGRVL